MVELWVDRLLMVDEVISGNTKAARVRLKVN
jgi:hypothetical protein